MPLHVSSSCASFSSHQISTFSLEVLKRKKTLSQTRHEKDLLSGFCFLSKHKYIRETICCKCKEFHLPLTKNSRCASTDGKTEML